MTEDREEKTIKADCGHYVATPDDLVLTDGKRYCADCAEYGPDRPE